MNALMNGVLGSATAQAIGWALLHLLWQGALVAGILAATLALLRNRGANVRYLASCAALALLIAMPVATAWRAYDVPLPTAPPPAARTFDGVAAFSATDAAAAPAGTTPTWSDRAETLLSSATAYLPQLVFAWLIGVAFLSLRLLYGWLEAQRLARDGAVSASPEWEAAIARIAEAMQLSRAVQLLESARVEVPTVIGWLRPIVLLPVATLSGLSPEQMEMVLAHELAHIRRHDFFVNLLQAVVETLLFYHPAVWWISRQVRIERENCCDDLAIAVCGNPLQYARALARLEELRIDPPEMVLAANGGSLIARIRRLVATRGESTNRASRWAAGAALVTVIVALLTMPTLPLFAKHETQATPQASPAPAPHATPAHDAKTCTEAHSEIDVNANDDDTNVDVDANDDVEVNVDADTDVTIVDTPEPPEPPDPPPAPRAVPSVAPAPPTPPAVRSRIAAPRPPAPPVAPIINLSEIVTPAVAEALREVHVVMPVIAAMPAPAVTPHPTPRAMKMRHRSTGSKKIGSGEQLSVEELIALRSTGVDAAYIREMRDAGFADLTYDDVISMRATGVSAKFVRDMRDAGLKIADADDAVALIANDVTPSYVKALRDAGYSKITTEDVIRLSSSGVTAEYIREMSRK